MEFNSAYIILRPSADGTAYVVHTGEKLKDTRYWLNYIAQPGDAIFLTSQNPQYKGSGGEPAYSCHLAARGKVSYAEKEWKRQVFAGKESATLNIVDPPKADSGRRPELTDGQLNETQILELANGLPHQLPLDQLSAVVRSGSAKVQVTLFEPAKWIDWESALTLMTQDVFVIGVDKASKWPLTIALKSELGKAETMNYEAEMRFVVRPRPPR